MIFVALLAATGPIAGYSGALAYKRCVVDAAVTLDDRQADPLILVQMAEAACRKEQIAMQSESRAEAADELPGANKQQLLLRSIEAARGTTLAVRKLAILRVQYSRNAHAQK